MNQSWTSIHDRDLRTIIHKSGVIVLEAVLDREEVLEAIKLLGPTITDIHGNIIEPKKVMCVAAI